jgi:hypothetical protein
VAETEQRFILHARSRTIARIIGYPAGLGLLAVAVFFPFGETSDAWWGRACFAIFGLVTLTWTWSMDRRRRIEVTEQKVTVVNTFSRYDVAWRELSDIELERIENQAGGTAFHRLAFVTPTKRIVAEAPAGSRREMMKARDRILRARPESPPNQTQPGDESPADDAPPAAQSGPVLRGRSPVMVIVLESVPDPA